MTLFITLKEFKTLDFFDTENKPTKVKHQCKMGFVSVLDDDGELDGEIGEKVLGLVEVLGAEEASKFK